MRLLILTAVGSFLIVNLLIPSLAGCDQSNLEDTLQAKVESLKIGTSDLDIIKKLFGKPKNMRKGMDWLEKSTNRKRTIYYAEYPSIGLSFAVFTNPSELYSITITTKDVSVQSIRIGDTLESVRKKQDEEGAWRTTDSQDCWWLVFKKNNLKIGFERDNDHPKYPIKLSIPELVTRIQLFNSKVSFY